MPMILRTSLSIGVLTYFIIIIVFLRKKALTLKYTILWIFSGLIMLFILICPGFIEWLSALLGIQTPSNTVFALTLFFDLIIVMSLTSIVSKLNEKLKKIIQVMALLEKRMRDIEEKADDDAFLPLKSNKE
jgi:hypothetical protein